jgi:predicted enzyme related to lactoylglutathione lyase
MTEPIINIYRTKQEAFYFKNSQINRFYSFNGVQLLPLNTSKYVQVTNTPKGINLEDWTVDVVDLCTGVKKTITSSFKVESLTNSLNGDPQFFWSLTNVPYDFGMNLIYLEIKQSLGETFYSTPFLLTNEEKEKTTKFTYKTKRTDTYQSIGFQTWFRQNVKQTELTTYYEASTQQTVTQAVKRNKIVKYVSEIMDVEQLIALTDVLENPYLYIDNIRASLFEAVEIPELTGQENFGSVTFNVSLNLKDTFKGDYVAPVIPKTPDYSSQHYSQLDYKTL